MKKRASIASLTAAALLWMPLHAHAACDGCVVNAVQSASSAVVNAIQTGIASVLKLLGAIDTNLSRARRNCPSMRAAHPAAIMRQPRYVIPKWPLHAIVEAAHRRATAR